MTQPMVTYWVGRAPSAARSTRRTEDVAVPLLEPAVESSDPIGAEGPVVDRTVIDASVTRVDAPDSVDAFCEEIADRLVGVLTLRLGDRSVAEEMAQEALARAVAAWSDVSQMQNPGGWVYRTALNLASSRFRRLRAERRAMDRVERAAPDQRSTEVAAQAVEFRAIIQKLSRRQQEVIALRFYADESVESTAAILGVSTGTVKTLTHRAIRMLRKHAAEQDDR